MCKISGVRPDNNATWIWKFQILEDFWWASAISMLDIDYSVDFHPKLLTDTKHLIKSERVLGQPRAFIRIETNFDD